MSLVARVAVAWSLFLSASSVSAQMDSVFIAAGGAACRAGPLNGAAVVTSLAVGDVLPRVDSANGWLRVQPPSGECWVVEYLAVSYSAERRAAALSTAAQEMIQRRPRPGQNDFDSLGRLIDNQIEDGADGSPDLHLTRLQFLAAVANENPRVQSEWVREHIDVLQYYESGGMYVVRAEAYQALYEQFADSPQAAELAWEYLRRTRPGECEDDPNCFLGRIEETYAEYWGRFPSGPYVVEALERAQSGLESVLQYACRTGRDDYTVVSPERLESLQASLRNVTAVERERVLLLVQEIRAKCP